MEEIKAAALCFAAERRPAPPNLTGRKACLSGVGEALVDDARESGKLMGVEKGVDGLKVNGVAGPETVRKSG